MRDDRDFDRDDVVLYDVEFKDKDGNYGDPTTVTLTIRKPDGTSNTYTYGSGTVLKTGTGIYYAQVIADAVGTWHYRWKGTGGTAAGADTGEFYVKKDVFD